MEVVDVVVGLFVLEEVQYVVVELIEDIE